MRNPINVLESLRNNATKTDYQYQRLYRNLYNSEFYLLAYQRIYAKQGNMTAGVDGKTVDGMSLKRINSIIEKMKDCSYHPNSAKRVYIPKSNGKMRPLGIPSFEDKLVQEVVRMILESIYEPTFCKTSHGFRPNLSCHTALQYVKQNFTGVKWFVEGDIKGCFDNIDHHVLIEIIRKRIQDEQFIALLWKFLKAGYTENWEYRNTYSGTPQGSIISPILANIYLNELDVFMEEYSKSFNKGNKRRINPVYKKSLDIRRGKQEWLNRNIDKISTEKAKEIKNQIQKINELLRKTPYGDPMDENYKRLVYVRYADDFLIGVIGNKENARRVKEDVGCFIRNELNLEMSAEKTLITHGNNFAHFLGYDITASNDQNSTRDKNGNTKRSYTGRIKLYVPKEKWIKRLISYGALEIKYDKQHGNKEVWKPTRRQALLRLDDLEILNQYNAEIRGLYNYYRLAHNVTVLNSFVYVMKFSMYKTFAGKYRTTVSKIMSKYYHNGDFSVQYEAKGQSKTAVFYNQGVRYTGSVNTSSSVDTVAKVSANYNRNSLIERLKAQHCEYCGVKTDNIEIHHVRKVKDLKGKESWEVQMIARKRKTLALCHVCHVKLHTGKLN